jgi:hypothetical protein
MKLGFGNSPRGRKVYLNRQYPECLWYFWDFATSKPIPILHESLTGYLKSIYISEKEFKNKPVQKLNFVMDCGDDRFILEVGIETIPARNLVEGFAVANLSHAITLKPSAGDQSDQALFVAFYDGTNRLKSEPVEEGSFLHLLEDLMLRVNGAPQEKPQEKPQSTAPTPPPQPTQKAASPKLPTLPQPKLPQPTAKPTVITNQQRQSFVTLMRQHGWSTEAVKFYLASVGYTHSSTIAPMDFESICDGITDAEIKQHFEEKVTITADQLGTWDAA